MTESLISLISISVGIIGALFMARLDRRYSFDLVGNTMAGVFGSILIIKSIGRLGFDPSNIMTLGRTNWSLFLLNLALSFSAGIGSVILLKKVQTRLKTMGNSKFDSIGIFKTISFLEGMSYVLLLFIAVPIKYIADNASFVKALGMPHGILFVLYIIMALFIRSRMKWGLKSTLFVLAASLLPFGTFYVNKKYL